MPDDTKLSADQILGDPVQTTGNGNGDENTLAGQPVPKVTEHVIDDSVLKNTGPAGRTPATDTVMAPPPPNTSAQLPSQKVMQAVENDGLHLETDEMPTAQVVENGPGEQTTPEAADVLVNKKQRGGTEQQQPQVVSRKEAASVSPTPLHDSPLAPPETSTSQQQVTGAQPQPMAKATLPSGVPPKPPETLTSPTTTLGVGTPGSPPVPPKEPAGTPRGVFVPPPSEEERQRLEDQAKSMVKELDQAGVGKKETVKKSGSDGGGKGKVVKTVLTALALVLVAGGVFTGIKLLEQQQSADIRQQAGVGDNSLSWGQAEWNECQQAATYDPTATLYMSHCYCPGPDWPSAGCQDNCTGGEVGTSGTETMDANYCGVQQIDLGCKTDSGFVISRIKWASKNTWTDACTTPTTPAPTKPPSQPTPTPTPPGNQHPSCSSLTVTNNNNGTATIRCAASDPDGQITRVDFAFVAAQANNDYCSAPWQIIKQTVSGSGGVYTFTWNISQLPNNTRYYVAANLWDNDNGSCTGNPSGICGTGFSASCPTCNTVFTKSTTTLPTPTLAPSPTQPPNTPLACQGIRSNVSSPKLGESVVYTCTGTGSNITGYEFEYSSTGGLVWNTLGISTNQNNVSLPLDVTEPGNYQVRCRVCSGSQCTNWGSLQPSTQ
jgi:hypothetical protein